MSIGDFFKNLVLDTWYKAFIYLGGVLLVLSLFLPVKGITNSQLQLLATGIFLLGIGEWKNHKKESWIKTPNVYTGPTALISRMVWSPDKIGLAFDLIGSVLIFMAVASILKTSRNEKGLERNAPIQEDSVEAISHLPRPRSDTLVVVIGAANETNGQQDFLVRATRMSLIDSVRRELTLPKKYAPLTGRPASTKPFRRESKVELGHRN